MVLAGNNDVEERKMKRGTGERNTSWKANTDRVLKPSQWTDKAQGNKSLHMLKTKLGKMMEMHESPE